MFDYICQTEKKKCGLTICMWKKNTYLKYVDLIYWLFAMQFNTDFGPLFQLGWQNHKFSRRHDNLASWTLCDFVWFGIVHKIVDKSHLNQKVQFILFSLESLKWNWNFFLMRMLLNKIQPGDCFNASLENVCAINICTVAMWPIKII